MKKTTREWVNKAEVDYRVARQLAANRPPVHDVVCNHCQQAVEKFLKALLNENSLSIPRTHDLEDLLGLLRSSFPSLRSFRRGLRFMVQFAVDVRYPGFGATKRQATSALRWAGRVRQTCRALLGLHPSRRRKRA